MQSTIFDLLMEKRLASSAGRTSPASPSFLAADGRTRVWLMDPPDVRPGGFWTLNITAWPSDGSGSLCSLAEVLEIGPLPMRYYLSSRACSGIQSRAERRGKALPAMFKQALQSVIERGAEVPGPSAETGPGGGLK